MKSLDNGVTWTGSADGLNSWDNTIGITGDGTNLYTGVFNSVGPILTSPESHGLHWTKFGNAVQTMNGPFEMGFDAINGIVYAACTGTGIMVLKVQRYTTAFAFHEVTRTPARDLGMTVAGQYGLLVSATGSHTDWFYDIKGRV